MLGKLIKLDIVLLISTILLLSIGLLVLYSISSAKDAKEPLSVFAKQCAFGFLGIGVMLFFTFSNYHYLKSFSTVIFFFSLLLLLAVLFWGSTVRGTVGWISLGPLNIQPVEIAKVALIVFLASYISQKKMELGELGRLLVSFLLTALMIFLVLKQPDFGSAVILVSIWAGMTIISGISRKHFLMLLTATLVVGFLSWAFLADYQKDRMKSFISPEFDPRGSGYSVIQSQIAVGSGGIFGKGIGHGSQSQLNFLPEKHNDFIFAVLTEELGLLGAGIILFLFIVLFFRLKIIAQSAPDNFGFLLASGVLIMLFVQVLINIGMNVGLIPVTGISLPFLSYGGSFLLTVFAAIGIVMNIGRSRERLALSDKID